MLSLGLGVTSSLTSVDALVRGLYSAGGVLPRVVLDFDDNNYVLDSGGFSFDKAFMGSSPKLTYSTAAGSNSTMVNSSGNIVWAPHNLLDYSNDLTSWSNAWSGGVALTPDDIVGPDGVNSLAKLGRIDGGSDGIFTSFDLTAGLTYTVSFVAKAGTSTRSNVFLYDLGALGVSSILTFSWGSPPTTVSSTNATDIDYADLGGGFYRISFSMVANTTTNHRLVVTPSDTGTSNEYIHFGQAAVYRSDLGGMAPVPGAATGFEYYVPTNGNAEYLPRVGHHVYNGSAWVNEGLLIESEPRTNLVTHSDLSSGWVETRADIDPNVTTEAAPDGTSNVTAITSDLTPANSHKSSKIVANPLTSTGAFTFSAFVKDNGTNVQFDVNIDPAVTVQLRRLYVLFDLQAGTAATPYTAGSPNVIDYGIQDVGGGWYRCHVTTDNPDGTRVDVALTLSQLTSSNANPAFDGDDTSGVFVYGAQFELGSTPSSYMPTSGGTYTRTAQSLEVPPAEFGWPEPEYIGPELVVDGSGNWVGDFDVAADVSEWTGRNANTQLSLDSNRLRVEAGAADVAYAYKQLTADANKVYRVTLDYENVQGVVRVYTGIGPGTNTYYDSGNLTGSGSLDFVFFPTSANPYISMYASVSNTLGDTSLFDNVSVREINPLSVSLQMDGRMTYADEGVTSQARFYRWGSSSSDRIQNRLYTDTGTGGVNVYQSATNGGSASSSFDNVYTPGINVPFNVASRHGSTFINGAVDGVAMTANTTPTALPDLSNTNLQIAYDFMGTIGTFRQFAGDIGDAGLVTATNPSTEPTLSLSFDGTGGSFYNLNWSE